MLYVVSFQGSTTSSHWYVCFLNRPSASLFPKLADIALASVVYSRSKFWRLLLLWLINILQANHSCYPHSCLRGVPFPDVPLQLGMKVDYVHLLLSLQSAWGLGYPSCVKWVRVCIGVLFLSISFSVLWHIFCSSSHRAGY